MHAIQTVAKSQTHFTHSAATWADILFESLFTGLICH